MATAKYTIAPPSLTPLLMEYGEYEDIPDECWREYIAAHRFWARAWEMYAGPPQRKRRTPPAQPPPEPAAA